MHSTLQSELRLTHRLLRDTCRYCTNRSNSPQRQFHQQVRSRAPHTPRDLTSSVTGSNHEHEARNANVKPEIALPVAKSESNSIGGNGGQIANGGPPPDDVDSNRQAGYYGSISRRKMRSRVIREQDPVQLPPPWFIDHNLLLFGDGQLSPTVKTKVKTIEVDPSTGEFMAEEKGSKDNAQPNPVLENKEKQNQTESVQSASTGSDVTEAEPSAKIAQESFPPSALSTVTNQLDQSVQALKDRLQSELKNMTEIARSLRGKAQPTSPAEVAEPRHYVIMQQWREVLGTLRGLMQLPLSAEYQSEPAVLKTHLMLQYAGKDGDVLLEELIESYARWFGVDLMKLDAQDISELICHSKPRQEIAIEARTMSYDIYNDFFGDSPPYEEQSLTFSTEENDEDDTFEIPGSSGTPMGMPVIIGKPISIDLKNMFIPSRGSNHFDSTQSAGQVIADMIRGVSGKSQSQPHMFTAIVDGLLKSMTKKQKSVSAAANTDLVDLRNRRAESRSLPNNSLLIHISDFRAIQDSPIGKQFLTELYEQVERRRSAGECVTIVGTDSYREEHGPYSVSRIEEAQRGRTEEAHRSIVITPTYPNTIARLARYQDRKRRIGMINLRHLWETMRFKGGDRLLGLQPGFWRRPLPNDMFLTDREALESDIWSFSYVHRLATFMIGSGLNGFVKSLELLAKKDGQNVTTEARVVYPIGMATARLEKSDLTKTKWAETQKKHPKIEVIKPFKIEENPQLARIRASANKYEKRLMSGVIEPEKISTTFNDVHVPVETIDALQTLTTLSLIRPEAFKYGVLASDKIPGLLLYGPPGTGKTLLAKAVAKESGATVLEVSAADINDMYVGEGEKNVKALFSLARKLSPCIVFLDEADAMFSARSNAGRRASHRELLNQFLKEWDGMSNDSGSAFIMVATNRPMDLDDAVLRRLPRRLLVDLPTELDRFEILKIHLRQEKVASEVNLADIAKRTPFYSGSDLKNVAVAAALNCVREENELAKTHTDPENPYVFAERRTLAATHFEKALQEISASISEDMSSLRDIKKFDEQYGDKGGRKRKTPKWGFRTADEAEKILDTVKVRS